MMRRLVYAAVLLAILGLWLFADRLTPAEIVKAEAALVRDGDTLEMGARTFRLYGVDAPEYRQTCTDGAGREWPCGKAARLQLSAFVAPGALSCEVLAKDQYHREVARCSSATVPDLSEALVQAGMAVSPESRGTAPYADAEAAAREAKRGLWQGSFELPAEWRARKEQGAG
jgi:endonuclease YncB( thermonuclease family)